MELWRLGTRTRKSGRRHIIAAAGGFGLVNQALTQRPWIQIQFSNKKQNLPIDPKPSLTIGSTEKRRCHVLHYSMASSIPWRMLLLRHKTIEILTQQHDEVRTIVCTCAKACGALAWSFSDHTPCLSIWLLAIFFDFASYLNIIMKLRCARPAYTFAPNVLTLHIHSSLYLEGISISIFRIAHFLKRALLPFLRLFFWSFLRWRNLMRSMTRRNLQMCECNCMRI